MSIHNVKEILEYVPEAFEHTKQAHVEKEFPTNSKDSTILSGLEVQYLTKIANETVSIDVLERVKLASDLYQVTNKISELGSLMLGRVNEKQASSIDHSADVEVAEEVIESMTAGLVDLEKVASRSEDLYDNYHGNITSNTVKLYAGAGLLNKEAAELALAIRYQKSGNEEFMKVAQVIHGSDVAKLSEEDNRLIARAVTELDKEAQLYGMDFYKDAFMVKEASISNSTKVKCGGQDVSAERIIAVAPSISNVIGEDVAKEISNSGPAEVKAIVESLPMDLKQLIGKHA